MSVYAYVDESGHTGTNLFDPAQPNFFLVGVMANFDLDSRYKKTLDGFAASEGFPRVHATEMGLGRLVRILPKLETWIRRDSIRFFGGRIVKRHLVVAKIFDTVFDPHENRAVQWHTYWGMPLRHALVVNLGNIVTDEILQQFWAALNERDEAKSEELFKGSMALLRTRVSMMPDARSQEIFSEALDWAQQYPSEIGFHSKKKSLALGHLPNLTAFVELLRAVDDYAASLGKPVQVVKHDRQSQIQVLLKEWHRLISNAGDGTIRVWDREFNVRLVSGSNFEISSSEDSAGIQIADIVLWLMKRRNDGKEVGPVAESFLETFDQNATPFDLSMRASTLLAESMIRQMYARDLSAEDLEKGQALHAEMEERRQKGLREFPIHPPPLEGDAV